MSRGIHKLTERECAKLIKAGKRGMTCDGAGLYLNTTAAGTASWIFRAVGLDGKPHYMGLGPTHTVSLAMARERARAARLQLLDGIDPLAQKRRSRKVTPKSWTFEKAAEEFVAVMGFNKNGEPWSAQYKRDWLRQMATDVHPVIGKLSTPDITTEDIVAVLQPKWVSHNVTMRRLRQQLEQVFKREIGLKRRTAANPALWDANLDQVLRHVKKDVAHFKALQYSELPLLTAELQQDASLISKALRLCIFTCLRTKEVMSLDWSNVDFKNKLLTMRPEQMKMNRGHVVPLSGPPLMLLEELYATRSSPLVFPGRKAGQPLHTRVMWVLLKKLRPGIGATVHGSTRAGFRSWVSDETSHDREAAEHVLAHREDDPYARGDTYRKRVTLMNDWARFLTTPVGDNVIVLQKAS